MDGRERTAGNRRYGFGGYRNDPNANQLYMIGVISDTHGLLRPEAVQALQGSELIVHAGDVGKAENRQDSSGNVACKLRRLRVCPK